MPDFETGMAISELPVATWKTIMGNFKSVMGISKLLMCNIETGIWDFKPGMTIFVFAMNPAILPALIIGVI